MLLRVLAVFLILAGAPVVATAADGNPLAYAITDLGPLVRVLHQPGFHVQPRGNVTIVAQAEGFVLIDSGGSPAAADEVIAAVQAMGGKPVTAIVLTHWHGDHVLGATRLLEVWPDAKLIASPQTAGMLAAPETDQYMPGDDASANQVLQENLAGAVAYFRAEAINDAYPAAVRAAFERTALEFERYADEMLAARRIVPPVLIGDVIILDDVDAPVHLRLVGRGNTEGDVIAYLPRQRIVVTGDLVVAPIPFGFNTYPAEWRAALLSLKDHGIDMLVPGHGAPQRDSTYLDTMIYFLDDAMAQAALLAPNAAVTHENALQHFNIAPWLERMALNDPWLDIWFRSYWAGPIAVSALKQARGEVIVQGD